MVERVCFFCEKRVSVSDMVYVPKRPLSLEDVIARLDVPPDERRRLLQAAEEEHRASKRPRMCKQHLEDERQLPYPVRLSLTVYAYQGGRKCMIQLIQTTELDPPPARPVLPRLTLPAVLRPPSLISPALVPPSTPVRNLTITTPSGSSRRKQTFDVSPLTFY